MDAQQFAQFMQAFTAALASLQPQPQAPQHAAPTPKISVKIPTFKGRPGENIMTWILQVYNLFEAQGIANEQTRIHYAATGFEDAALHWYLNKVTAAGNHAAFADWATFADALHAAFQPQLPISSPSTIEKTSSNRNRTELWFAI